MSKILLIEDDEYISRVYERAFRLGGHEIDIHADAESAWKKLSEESETPAAIVIDLQLPQMTGTELLAKIHADARLAHVPVAILTNSFNEDIEKQLLADGADLYLLKIDHEPKDIIAQIEGLIRKSEVTDIQ